MAESISQIQEASEVFLAKIVREDHIVEGGAKQKFAFNSEATPILKALEAEARLIPFENPNSRPTFP